MRNDTSACALSWCNIQVCFPHNLGLFLRTETLKRSKTSWYNCLFTIWPSGTNSWWTMPFQSKNTTNNNLIFDRLMRALSLHDALPIYAGAKSGEKGGWGHNGCLMFCQIAADEERRVSRRIVVVQHPSLVFQKFKPLPAHNNPQTH